LVRIISGDFNMTDTRLGLPALFMTSILATPVSATEWDIAFGGYSSSGFRDAEGGFVNDDRGDFRLRSTLTADNGITFSSRVEFESSGSTEEIDEAFTFVRGSFGRILLESDDGSYRNARRPDDFSAGGCARFGADGQLEAHVPLRFDGVGLSVGYSSFLDDNVRGALATEDGVGNVTNPAVDFDYRLSGTQFGGSASYCLDVGRILPAKLSASFNYSRLSGNDTIENQALPFGLGITGVGYAPGVFVNSPTDIQRGIFDLNRTAFGGGLEYMQPLGLKMSDENRATLSAKFFGTEVARAFSFIVGLDFGMADQDETVEFRTSTPAFGINSGADIRYDTSFDISTYNLRLGLQHERHALNGNNVLTSTFLRGTLGYSFVDVDASDRVFANGLGGALNINNSNRISESDGMETATFEVGISRSKDNISGGFSIALDYGSVPLIDYSRPDSTPGGVPLDPVIDIGGDWSARIGGGIQFRF